MNIGIGKFGRSMKFDKSTWNIYAGDDSPKIIYFELAKRHPEHTFYILNPSDFTKYKQKYEGKEYIPDNIVDLYYDAKHNYPYRYDHGKTKSDIIEHSYEALVNAAKDKNVKIDLGLFMQGMDFAFSVPEVGLLRKDGKEARMLDCAMSYCGNLIYFINYQGFKWYNINEDPRYLPYDAFDILNDEEYVFSQVNKTIPIKRIVGYGEDSLKQRDLNLEFKYSGIEKMFLAEKPKIDFSDPTHIQVGDNVYQKNNDFIMTLNEGPSRRQFIENWILKFRPDTKIYGRWKDEKTLKAHPDTFICKGILEIEDLMWSSKFTFVPCFNKSITNFLTQKVYKSIYYGIIPFWDKNTYDTDNIYKEIPDYFKVESPEEMWEKIDYLNSHEDEYRKYLKIYYDLLEDKYFNGDFIEDTFGPVLK